MNKLEENRFLQEICQRLDASIEHLNPSIRIRLDDSRRDALQSKLQPIAQEEDSLAQKVRRELNDNTGVSPEIETRLDQIRQQAMARLDAAELRGAPSFLAQIQDWFESRFSIFSSIVPGTIPRTMLATACVLVTVISIFYVNSRPTGSLSLEEEISLVASAEDIELYENLDFYLWLAENESLTL